MPMAVFRQNSINKNRQRRWMQPTFTSCPACRAQCQLLQLLLFLRTFLTAQFSSFPYSCPGKVRNWPASWMEERKVGGEEIKKQQQPLFSPSSLQPEEDKTGKIRIFYLKSNSEILSQTHFISALRLYFQLKMTIDRPVYYLRVSTKVMGPRRKKFK